MTSPHGKGVQEQHYFSVHQSVRHQSRYLLNHWEELTQTVASLGGRVRESNFFFFQSVHPSVSPSHYPLLNHWVEYNLTCYMTSPHGKAVLEQHYFHFRLLSGESVVICDDVPWTLQSSLKT